MPETLTSLFMVGSILVLIYPMLVRQFHAERRKPCPIRVKRTTKR